MNVFSVQTGNGDIVSIPNNLEEMSITSNCPYKHVLVYINGVHVDDKRVGTTEYEVSVTRVSRHSDGVDAVDGTYDYIHIIPVGTKGTVDVVTLKQVSA
jgi:hypothetical protein